MHDTNQHDGSSIIADDAKLALLIDADNVSAKYLPTILDELPKYGMATYKRIYGDFTDPQMASWRAQLLDNSIVPVQQFSNVKHKRPGEHAGKNATDSTLIIDAMDILYTGNVDGFVIVSSDSDFTRLASRLREGGKTVIGMGRANTSVSFRRACTRFVNIERLHDDEEADEREQAAIVGESSISTEDVSDVIAAIIRGNDDRGHPTLLASVGAGLSNRFPEFDVREFGYSKLSKLIDDLDRFELIPTYSGFDVQLRDTSSAEAGVAAFITDTLARSRDRSMLLSDLGNEVRRKFPDFDVKDAGYSSLSKFARSIDGVEVIGQPGGGPAHARLT